MLYNDSLVWDVLMVLSISMKISCTSTTENTIKILWNGSFSYPACCVRGIKIHLQAYKRRLKGLKVAFCFFATFFYLQFSLLVQSTYTAWISFVEHSTHTRYSMVSCRLRFTAKILGDKGNLKLNVNKVFKYVIPKCELLMNEVRFKLFGGVCKHVYVTLLRQWQFKISARRTICEQAHIVAMESLNLK